MKAIVVTKYGGPEVLQLMEVAQPVPTDDQVLVKIHVASVNKLDLSMRGPLIARIISGALFKPKNTLLGVDIAGRVKAVGSSVSEFQPGDEVFGVAPGAFAEYTCANKAKLALKPANVSFEAAAATPVAAFTALQGIRDKGQIQQGQKVLINGAGGGVGTFAVQIARAFGAEVTATCSTHNLEMARSIGADRVIDYTREDVTKDGQRYDLIVAVNGYHPILDYRRILSPNGTYVVAGGELKQVFDILVLGPLLSKFGSQKMVFMGIATTNQKDLLTIRGLLESGKVVPVIDRRYPLSEVADAVRYLEEGHAGGKVVITVEQSDKL